MHCTNFIDYRNRGETVLDGHDGSVSSCCFSSDGKIAILA